MKPRFVLLLAPALLLLHNGPALAKGYQLEVGAFVGAHFFSSDNGLGRERGQPEATALTHSGLVGARLAYFFRPNVGLELELGIIPTTTRHAGVDVVALGYRGHLVANLLTGRVRPFVLVGGGGFSSTSSNHNIILEDSDGEVHAGIGVKAELNRSRTVGLRFDARMQFSPGLTQIPVEDWELMLGVYGLIGRFTKAAAPAPPPEPVRPPPGELDYDGDGVVDRLDECPNAKGSVENRGCPDPDTDGDGVVDRLDECPNAPGPADNKGCPVAPSPQPQPQPVAEPRVIEGIQFRAGKADLEAPSFAVLDDLAKTLLADLGTKVEIAGHTDESGSRSLNQELSQKRAEAVRSYLVKKGVAKERMSAVGYGADKPLGDNQSEAGRAKNRRVEIKLLNAAKENL